MTMPAKSNPIRDSKNRIKLGVFATNGNGAAFTFHPDRFKCTWEANLRLAQKAEAEEAVLLMDLQLLPRKIYSRDFYSSRWKEAENRIGTRDPKDVDLLALALKLRVPIWSNDPDFQSARVRLYTTAELLKILEAKPE